MNSRALIALFAALAVLVALSLAVSMSEKRQVKEPGLLLPDLRGQLNGIGRIEVRIAGDKVAATLERREGQWVVAERAGYPADLGKISKNLIALAEARIVEEKTSNPALYGRLGVDDIATPAAAGVQLDVVAGERHTKVIVGNAGPGADRTYARRAGEATSWLVSGGISPGRDAADWLDRTLVSLPTTRLYAVTVTAPDGKALRIEKGKADPSTFEVLDLPAGRQLAFPGAANAVAGVVSDLALDGVEPAAGFSPGDTKPVVTRFEMQDGLVLEVKTWKAAAGTRVAFAASVDAGLAARLAPPPPPPPPPKPEAPAAKAQSAQATTPAKPGAAATGKPATQAKPAAAEKTAEPPKTPEPKRPTLAEVKAEADQINARLGKWVYALPEFKVEELTRRMDDMLEPLAAAPKPGLPAKTPARKPPASPVPAGP